VKHFILLFTLALSSVLVCSQVKPAGQPASREDILHLFDTMHLQKQMEDMQKTMADEIIPMIQQGSKDQLKDMTPEEVAQLDAMMKEGTEESLRAYPVSEMMADMVPAYQKVFTKEDVKAIAAFYSSPAGQKYLNKLPQLSQESMKVLMPKMQQRMSEQMARTRQKLEDLYKQPPAKKSPPSK
jgi:hypothetical protein